ncbi:MAG: hypothetical protein EOP38_23140 [Rubrivivax sp.]|nr:MAG: hypothetical protein EOP38_23140 [Rubrivivax sp.]
MDPIGAVSLLAAGSIMALFAWIGFNRPSWSRTYTTAARYRTAMAAHIAVYLGLTGLCLALLCGGLAALGAPLTVSTVSGMIWAALLLMLCLRTWPWATRLRLWIHRRAGIPSHAHRVAQWLAGSNFEPSEAINEEARQFLLCRGIDVSRDWLPVVLPAHRLLLQTTALFVQLRAWDEQPAYAEFVCEASNEFDLLRRRFDRLSFRVARTLASIERLGEVRHVFTEQADGSAASSGQLDELLRRIVGDMIADSCEDIRALHGDACLLAARGVMATRTTRRGRDLVLSQMGFVTQRRRVRPGWGVLVGALLILFFGNWLRFLFMSRTGQLTPGVLSVVTLNLFAAVVLAVVPKMQWGFANGGLHARTPVRFVVGAGVCAVVFAALVNLAFGAATHGLSQALPRFMRGVPYLHLSFVMAATMAWLVQNHRWQSAPPAQRRWLDAGTLALVWAVACLLARLLRAELRDQPVIPEELVKVALTSLVFGGVLGYAIPGLVRAEPVFLPDSRTPQPPSDFVRPSIHPA